MKLEPKVHARPRELLPDGTIRVAARYHWAGARMGLVSLAVIMVGNRLIAWAGFPTPWDLAAAGTLLVVWAVVLLAAYLPARILRFQATERRLTIRTRPELLRAHRIVIPFSKIERVEVDGAGALTVLTDEGPLEVAHVEQAERGAALVAEVNTLLEKSRGVEPDVAAAAATPG